MNDLARMIEQKRADAGIVAGEPRLDVFARVAASIGQISPERNAEIMARRAADEAESKRRKAVECMSMLANAAGDRYRGCRIDNFKITTAYQQQVVDAVREYGNCLADRIKERQGLVLFGPVGTGKDHLAFAIAMHAAHMGNSVKWINGQGWFGKLRDAMDTSESERSIICDIERADLVVFSDPLPPVGDLSQYQSSMLYRAIEARYSKGKITFTTINVADDNEADRRMGAATWDRLCHNAWKIYCRWPSYRKPARVIKP